jgi:dihydrolipoamide dehydrogenase
MPENNYDIVVLGGGTGGYSAAFRARELGLSVALVERAELGGTCLHKGCIPAKSLLQAALFLEEIERAPSMGLEVSAGYDWKKIMAKKAEVVGQIYAGLRGLAKERGVEIIHGTGRLDAENTITVDTEDGSLVLGFRNAVLATGSKHKMLPGLEPGGPIITSDEALNIDHLPKSVIVIGGGYIGVEFGSMLRSFGVDVSIIEMAPRLMLQEDEEIAMALEKAFEDRGFGLFLDARIKKIDCDQAKEEGVTVEVEKDGKTMTLEADKLLVAIGRYPVTGAFKDAGIATDDHGCVETDDRLMTSRPGVYAVGDILATPQLAHAAFAEGIYVAENIAGQNPEPIEYQSIPHCLYTHPEVAGVGLTEAQARERGYDVKVARESFRANSRARIAGEAEGEVKIVSEKNGPILGIHMIGPSVSELASEAMLITGWEADADDLARFIHPHPTFSEAIGEGALKLAGKPLHSI